MSEFEQLRERVNEHDEALRNMDLQKQINWAWRSGAIDAFRTVIEILEEREVDEVVVGRIRQTLLETQMELKALCGEEQPEESNRKGGKRRSRT